MTSPNEVSERLYFAAIGLRSSVSILITSETELGEHGWMTIVGETKNLPFCGNAVVDNRPGFLRECVPDH